MRRSTADRPLGASLSHWARLAATAAAALLTWSAIAAAAAPVGVLENPEDGSTRSGIGVISGWVCEATSVTVTIDGSQVLEAAYGTPRDDTASVCGDSDNGFGLLWNFNLFGPGAHTAVAAADGMEFGSATFVVSTVGAVFEPSLSGRFTIQGFPNASSAPFDLVWQTSAQSFVIAPVATTGAGTAAPRRGSPAGAPAAVLENPAAFVSGIWLFSGWVCDAAEVTLTVDGGAPLVAAYGTERQDTVAACGDADNGFALLWNFNLFGPGDHTVVARADGVEFGSSSFTVTGFGSTFLRGASGSFRLTGFPGPLDDTFVQWDEAAQNFVVWARAPTGAPTPTPAPIPTPSPPGGSTPTPGGSPTPGGATPTPTPQAVCGNGVVEPGEQCDGSNLNGFDADEPLTSACEAAYAFGLGDCAGGPLACRADCTFQRGDDPNACVCSCEDDADCSFPSDPDGRTPPIGIDCTDFFCPQPPDCPCDHLLPDDEFIACADEHSPACDAYVDCIDDVGCFLGSEPENTSYYAFSSDAGLCESGFCETEPDFYLSSESLRRQICTSKDPFGDYRCLDYCESDFCDCTNPDSLPPYHPATGDCAPTPTPGP